MTYGYISLSNNKFVQMMFGGLLLMVITIATSLNVQAQTILSEEMRSGELPASWTATDVEFITSASGYAKMTGTTGVLTSPSFDLSGVTGATLQFSVAKFGQGADGPITVEFSIDGGTNWDAYVDSSGVATSSTYLNEEITLPGALIGQADVMVRFSTVTSESIKRLRDVLLVGPAGVSLAPATEVATIAELRAGVADGETRYRLTGEAVIAFYDSYNKRRYLVDGTAGIFSEDPGNLPDSLKNIGDGISGIEGTISLVNSGALLRFNPDAGSTNLTVTTGNELTPETINLADVSLDDTGKLITVPGVTFQETGVFASGQNYTLDDGNGNTLTFRTDYFAADYIGEAIPTGKLNITGMVGGFGSSAQMFARSSADIVEAPAGPVAVTFVVNTATLADTAMPNHVLQMRGSGIGSAIVNPAITWGDDTGIVGTNIGGDYWEFNFELMPGDSLEYKFWVGTDANTAFGNGWENLSNRKFGLAADASGEITAPIHYFNRTESPFEEKTDSVGVLFRVNVGAQVQLGNFDPAEHTVSVRGGYAPLSWDDGTVVLDKETGTSGDNAIYSKIVYFHGDSLVSHTPFNYKFYLNNNTGDGGYESSDDRPFNLTTAADTTLHVVNFSNKAPIQGTVLETNLNFEVNVGILEGLGFFNATIDTVFVRGDFNGWGNADRMTYNSFTGTFAKSGIAFTSTVGADVSYKYYIKWDERRDEEGNEFYLSGVSADGSGWEEPGVTGGGNRKFQLIDDANQPVRSEFYNGIEPQALLTESNVDGGAISITFSIDMNPAMGIETSPFKPATDSVFLFVDTPFFALTNGITVPGDDGGKFGTLTDEERERLRFTDTEGNGIYKLTLDLTLPTLNSIGFRIAYGEPTSESGNIIINGEGFDAGRRYYQYIQPQIDTEGEVTWPSTFAFPQLTWQAENLPFEAPPSYTSGGVSVEKLDDVASFSLDQNYPNPFNPTTNIRFNLANAANVTLSVYNVLGQKVASLVNNTRFNSGSHIVAFDARNLASGIYLYRIEAGNFVSQKRMTLIK